MSHQNVERFNTLDFLRGIAILGVISVHASLSFPTEGNKINFLLSFGMYGVQLFYLVSAITMCLMWEYRIGDPTPVKNFYIRRFLRIAPLFWLAIPIYLSINGYEPSYWAPNGIGVTQIVLTALFLHGLWPDAINSVVPGGWSIAVEMTFYLIFPYLISKFKNKPDLYLYAAIFIWFLNTLFLRDYIGHFFSAQKFNLNPRIIQDYLNLYFLNQAPVFFLGCWLYFSLKNKISTFHLITIGAWITCAAVLKLFFYKNGFGFLLIYLTLLLFVYVCITRKLQFRPFDLLGKNSYAIYLSHFLVLSFVYRIMLFQDQLFRLFAGIFLTVIISFFLSQISYFLIEKNFAILADKLTAYKSS